MLDCWFLLNFKNLVNKDIIKSSIFFLCVISFFEIEPTGNFWGFGQVLYLPTLTGGLFE